MNKQCILLVEDNRDDELLTLRALRKNNMVKDVIVVRDGEQALDYLFGRGEYAGRDIRDVPRMVLLDLKLPKLNGIEVLKQIRGKAETRYIPVVMLTTSDENKDITASYNNSANSYICKPVDFEQFIEAIRQLGSYWLGLNKTPML